MKNKTILYIIIAGVLSLCCFYGFDALRQRDFKNKILEEELIHQEKLEEYCKTHPLTDAFESLTGYVFLNGIIENEAIKNRIIMQYSQEFYNLLPLDGQGDRLDYDTETSLWLCAAKKDSTLVNLYYNDKLDRLEINLYINDLPIDRNGECKLGDHNLRYPIDKRSKKYKHHIEDIRTKTREERNAREEHEVYLENLTLRPAYNTFDYWETTIPEIIANLDIKKRIIEQYSEKFYRLLNIWDGASKPQFGHFNNEAAIQSIEAANEHNSYVKIVYNTRTDDLNIILKIKGIDINSFGEHNTGIWQLDYFNNDFGEKVKDSPYIILRLTPDKVNRAYYDSDDRFIIRISNHDGVAIMYKKDVDSAFGDYVNNSWEDPTLLIRRESDGEVFNIKLTRSTKHKHISYVDRNQYDLFFKGTIKNTV